MFSLSLCFFFRQKTAYVMRISDWNSDVCSSDLIDPQEASDPFKAMQVDGIEVVCSHETQGHCIFGHEHDGWNDVIGGRQPHCGGRQENERPILEVVVAVAYPDVAPHTASRL